MFGNRSGMRFAMRCSTIAASSSDVPTAAVNPQSVIIGEQMPLPHGWKKTSPRRRSSSS